MFANVVANMGKSCMTAAAGGGLVTKPNASWAPPTWASTTTDTTTTAEVKEPEMTFSFFKPTQIRDYSLNFEYCINETRTHLPVVRSMGSGLQGSMPVYLKEQVFAGSASVFAAEVRAVRVQSHALEYPIHSHPLKDISSDNEEDADDQEAKDVNSHPLEYSIVSHALEDVSSDWEDSDIEEEGVTEEKVVEGEAAVAAAAAGCKKEKVHKRGGWVSRMWRKRRAVGSPASTPPALIAAYHGSASSTRSSESSSDGSFASEGVLSSQSSLSSSSYYSTESLSREGSFAIAGC